MNFLKSKFILNYYKKYVPKLSYTVLEHGVYSGSNFILNILLARLMTQTEYGLFVVVIAIFSFGASIHNAIILEPYSVFFFTKFNENIYQYSYNIFLFSILLALILAIVAILVSISILLFTQTNYLVLTIIVSFYMISSFLEITIRRTYYSLKLYSKIFLISSIRLIISIILILLFYNLNILNIKTVFIILFIITISVFIIGVYNISFDKITHQKYSFKKDVFVSHWNFGKWGLLNSLVHWVSNYGYLLIIGYFLSVQEIGGLKAMQNILSPFNLFSVAIGTLLITYFSSNITKGVSWISKQANRISNLATISITIAVLIIYLLHKEIIILLYDGKYIEYSFLLIYLMFITILTFRTNVLSMVLRSMEKTKEIFISNFITSISTILIGIALIKFLALKGAAINFIITSCILTVSITIFYRKVLKD